MRRFSFLIIFFILSASLLAQKKKIFSGEPVNFHIELKEFMSNITGANEDVVEKFIKAWVEDSIFNQIEQSDIIRLSQLLVKSNARPDPHFLHFLSGMMAFKEFNKIPDNYTTWVEGFEEFIERKRVTITLIDAVLEFTDLLLRENIIYKSGSTTWKVSSKKYKILNNEDLAVEFDNTDLICYAKRDSMHLFKTQGAVFPAENIWKGNNGLVTWERGGYSRDSVFASLDKYEIDLARSEYSAEDVIFTNKYYFDEPLKGVLNDKVKFNKEPEDASYPRFDSYTKKFVIPGLYENIDYEGGLSMQGSKLVGTGTRQETAKLKIYRHDTLVLVASSVFFGFRSDRISSLRTSVTIRLNNDSIYHPDLFFTYRVRNNELTLLKTENYSSQGPYFNSYHKVDMNFDQLTWRMNENLMKFSATRGSAIGNAYFESLNYFNYDKFMNMMMMDKNHPLVSLRSYARKYGYEGFLIDEYADYLNMPLNQVEQLVMRMAFGGFVFYDSNTGMVTLKPRLHDYLAASINKIDYDVIGFSSRVDAPLENAIFDISTYDLTINGIPQIYVSDSQNVVFYPRGNKIILKNNRNFQFDGTVEAGLLTFFGNNFFFSYDSFKVNLQNVDSLHIKYLTGKLDNYGFSLTANVENIINSVTGEVLIDKPDNKSGRGNNPDYPIFISKENSFVYYEDNRIQKGVYESNDFFFEIYPFEMDSLDNFNYQDLVFRGDFVSAGIFPTFEKELSLQPDNSLGFRHMTPADGFPVYGGKGDFYNEIWLSNKGLKGDGKLEYLTSTAFSKDFNFYPDSLNTIAYKYDIARKTSETQFPKVSSSNNNIHWLPYNDKMFAQKIDKDFMMFNDSTTLSGNLLLEPTGLSGAGRMDLKNSDLYSDHITYLANDIFSDTADFYLKSLHSDGFTVLTENVNAHINYSEKKGWFKSNEAFSLVSFPDNKYVSYIDNFMWDMSKKELAMGSGLVSTQVDYTDEDKETAGPRYISTDRSQDSLSFVSPLAYYDYQNNYIKATGVKFIQVADARIYPNEGKLIVEPDAHIQTLEEAKIIADTLRKYHTLYKATLNIQGKKYYNGIANYDYVDENGKVEMIHFNKVEVDTATHTIASGEIFESSGFYLSPVYKYQGKVFLNATDSLLTFNGSTLIEHNCEKLMPDWLYFKSRIDPNNIYIPISDQPVNIDRNKLQAGVYLYYDSTHVYPSFLTPRKSYSDRTIVTSKGYLYYDKNQMLFKIGSKEKINDYSLPEDYLSLHREACKLSGEGRIDLGEELGQVKLNAYGGVRHDIEANETNIDLVLMIDFFMSGPMINLMANEIDSIPDLEAADLNRMIYKKAMEATVGPETAKKLNDELFLFGTIKQLPDELKHTIVFNELSLKWNNVTNSYQSVGKIGIGSINQVQINKKVNGFFELQIKRSGDILDFYLELDSKSYYYFGYTRGVMQTLSNNRNYVEAIMNIKPKDRKMKVPKNETSYIYLISTDRKKNVFYRRYRNNVEGVESIYEDERLTP